MPINNSSINIAAQNDFIRARGEWVHYFIGLKCPCTGAVMMTGSNLSDPNRADINCQACGGLGWVWQDGGQILGIVEGIMQQKELLLSGIAAPGDMVFTPDLRYTLSDYDKIQLTWPEGIPFEGELITRGSGATDNAIYGIMSVGPNGCITIDPKTGVVTTYALNVDFTYSGKVITWQGTHMPAMGSVYSLKYAALVDWICYAPPQPRRERGTNLGQRVVLKKKHVVFNGV